MAVLQLDPSELQGLLEQTVSAVVAELDRRRILVGGKLALTEPAAAELLNLNSWQLRDLRLSGKIAHRRIVRNQVRYTLDDLTQYLDRHFEPGIHREGKR